RRAARLSASRAAAGRHHTPPSLSLAASPEGYDDGKQRWLYAASEPNLTTIGIHSLSPGPFPCNTLAPAPRDGSTIWSISSTNSNKRKPLAGAADWRKNCYATI